MPALLVPIIASALSATALSSTALFAVSTIAANAIVAGAALGLQLALQPGQQAQKVASQQYQSRQALPTLLYGYGADKLGGAKFAFEAPNGSYLDGLIHCAGPISSFQAWILNDKASTLPSDTPSGSEAFGGSTQILPWGSNVTVESHRGQAGQISSAILSGALSGKWTPQHRLDGLCYSVLRAAPVKEKFFQKVYPNGPPSLSVIARLAPVYDPRDGAQSWDDPGTWKWSSNPGLAILHYLTAIRGLDSLTGQPVPYGFGLGHNRIDLPSFATFASICEQAISRKSGVPEVRYAIGGTFDMGNEERKVVLARLLASCDGEIYQTSGGKIALRGGIWSEPTLTITADHILGYEFEGGADKLAAFNRLKISFKDPFNDYQIIEGDPWDDLDDQALVGETSTQDLTLPMVQSHSQARRLAKIATAKANPKDKLTLTTDIYGLLALGERIIRVVLPELEIDGTFLITAFTESSDGATCQIGIASLGPEAYAWDPAQEEGTPPAVATGLSQPTIVPDVENLTLSDERIEVGGSVTGLGIVATVDAPSDTNFELHGRARPAGSGDDAWIEMGATASSWSVVYRPAADGQEYEVQVAFWAPFGGTQGPYTASQIITATADETSPGSPTGFVANGGPGQVMIAFTAPDSANVGSVKVYSVPGTSGAGAPPSGARLAVTRQVSANQSIDLTDARPAGTHTYWVRSLNRSGYPSAIGDTSSVAGPITATVT